MSVHVYHTSDICYIDIANTKQKKCVYATVCYIMTEIF